MGIGEIFAIVIGTLAAALGGQNYDLQKELEAAKAQIAAQAQTIETRDQTIQGLKARSTANAKTIGEQAAKNAQLTFERVQKELEALKIQQELEREISNLTELTQQNADLQNAFAKVQNALNEAQQTIGKREKELEKHEVLLELGRKHARELVASQKKLLASQTKIAALQTSLRKASQEIAEGKNKMALGETKLAEALQDLDKMTKERDKALEERNTIQKKFDDLYQIVGISILIFVVVLIGLGAAYFLRRT